MLIGNLTEKEEIITLFTKSKTAYHTVDIVATILREYGYVQISEMQLYPDFFQSNLDKNNKFFVIRNDSSIIAFKIDSYQSMFKIVASHTDSPALKIKPNGYNKIPGDEENYKVSVSGYGSGIWHTWFDRPLKIAGRYVQISDDGEIKTNLFEDDIIARIPSIAIHMEKNVNEGKNINLQNDMNVLINADSKFGKIITNSEGIDLYFVNAENTEIYGNQICSPRIDNLASIFSSLDAFLNRKLSYGVSMIAMFDNEEIGSRTYQGANSDFIDNVIYGIFGKNAIDREKSFIISFDGAHATPINNLAVADLINPVYLGKGIVIKYNDNYCTNGITSAKFKSLCNKAKEPYQIYTCRSDIKCGGTIGTILTSKLGIQGVDVGIPMHGMHSISETADFRDYISSINILKTFFESF